MNRLTALIAALDALLQTGAISHVVVNHATALCPACVAMDVVLQYKRVYDS